MKQKLRPLEVFMNLLFFVCGLIAVVFVLFISIYLIVSGLPAIREIGLVDFLFGTEWASTAAEPKFGILPFILTSIYGTPRWPPSSVRQWICWRASLPWCTVSSA